ncbi:hydrolase, TatD family protein [Histomonas meleagridis]|uniref:hydrolase, TatD family protein n=1 Tax=Histomonas meleagridis TaxID=135588 RepID=UPI003559BEC8|nr:hydrolase, TatD family protein [Histomonas meleagridis]KAH0803452.1 hydrolase, TatD family protein [Histomonas meleagridis]
MAKNLPYVDCHTHLDAIYEKMGLDLNEPFEKFSESWPEGFDGCLATFSDTFEGVMKFVDSGNPKIFGALGLHPHGASRYNDEFEAQLIELLKNPRVKALGEIGLDYHYTLSPVDVQKRVFEREIQLAVERQLPITIHTREAEDDTFEILKRAMPKDHFFHIHCFTDGWEFAEKVLKEWPNSFFGFTGVLTFKNSKKIQDVCKKVPIDRILSETDGPYMAPIPHRGKAAWPGHIPIIIKKVAELHEIPVEEGFEVLRENCRKIYHF